MKRFVNIALLVLTAVVFAGGMTSCDSLLYEGEGDCGVILRFKYDFNMKYADAFPNEVHSVALYVFDQEGKLVTKVVEEGISATSEDYYMTVPVEEGIYDLVAWCGLAETQSFTVPDVATKAELQCRLNTVKDAAGNPRMGTRLGDVFYGCVEDVNLQRLAPGSVNTVVIPLVKNTNSIKVLLQALENDETLTHQNYSFEIVDNNAVLGWDNNVVASPVCYDPWSKSQASVDVGTKADKLTAALAEFSVNRLIKRDTDKAMLVVKDLRYDKEVIRIALVDFFLMVKGHYGHDMTDQEYLDRQDDYTITFYIDNRKDDVSTWFIAMGIYINGWHVVLQNSNLN